MVVYGLKPGTYKAHADTPYTYLDGVLLAGSLYENNKFDLVGCNEKLARFLLKNDNITRQITVVLNNGKIHNSKLYWWHDSENKQHGIVCDLNDQQANIKAAIQYNNRVPRLDNLV